MFEQDKSGRYEGFRDGAKMSNNVPMPEGTNTRPTYQSAPSTPPSETVYQTVQQTPTEPAAQAVQPYTAQPSESVSEQTSTVYTYESTSSENAPPVYTYAPSSEQSSAKIKRRMPKTLLKGALSVALMAAVSVGSITGYVWYDNTYGGGANGGRPEGNIIEQTYYRVSETEDALTMPEVYQKVSPSVVTIETELSISTGFSTATAKGLGTGIVMSEDGYIMTNEHVIDDATKITVTLTDGRSFEASVVGADPNTDIAVIKVEADDLLPAEFGDSTELMVGETAIVIGNPVGVTFSDTMTQGIISATERQVKMDEYTMTVIQTDASINSGNSGGPLINSRGQVIGVVNSKISKDGVEGIGFAIPTSIALDVAEDLMEYGYVSTRPMLGITVQSLSDEIAAMYGMEAGLFVQSVEADSAAARGGMQIGDQILSYNGTEVNSSAELNTAKEQSKAGDTVTIIVERDGEEIELQITYGPLGQPS